MTISSRLRRPWQPNEHLYLFLHVGKCAGTSLVHSLGTLGRRGISLGFPADCKRDVRRHVREELIRRRISPHRVRAFFGHRVYYGLHHLSSKIPRYFTFLRNPRERVRSLYCYHCDAATDPNHPIHARHRDRMRSGGELLPFEDWLHNYYVGNQMVRFCAFSMHGERVHEPFEMDRNYLNWAKEFLSLCWFIGFAESSRQDMQRVCQAIGISAPQKALNKSKNWLSESDFQRLGNKIDERDHLDCELFEYAHSLRDDQ